MDLFAIGIVVATFVTGDFVAADGASIEGWVVNESSQPVLCAGVEVVLRVQIEGQFVPVEQAVTDPGGRFVFDQLPVGEDVVYLPGANFEGVHYPGERLRLSAEQPHARIKLVVFDSIAEPSPLLAESHHILVEPEAGFLQITESIVVVNRSSRCFVGRSDPDGVEPITLRLAIPDDFRRVTFHKEFFGRQFSMRQDELTTAIPWPPGKRKLELTYVIANDERHRVLQRALDLACSQVRLTIRSDDPSEVACNLPKLPDSQAGQISFGSVGTTLPAGHVIRAAMGHLPIPALAYARWVAVAVLIGSLVGVISWTRQRGNLSAGLSGAQNRSHQRQRLNKSRQCRVG